MTHTRQLSCLDAVTLAQLASHFDPLPGDAPVDESAADCAALRALREREGRFCPRPAEPPWADPRPDLTGDHGRWSALLALAWAVDGPDPDGVYGALCGVRCCGAALVTDVQPLDLTPEGPPLRWRLTRGELPEAEWQTYRTRWLWPHKDVLTKLLQGGGA